MISIHWLYSINGHAAGTDLLEVPIPYIRPIFQAYVRGYTPIGYTHPLHDEGEAGAAVKAPSFRELPAWSAAPEVRQALRRPVPGDRMVGCDVEWFDHQRMVADRFLVILFVRKWFENGLKKMIRWRFGLEFAEETLCFGMWRGAMFAFFWF